MPLRSHRRKAMLAGAALIGAPALLAQPPIVLRFSHVVAPDTPKGTAADFFAMRAAELTGGRVRVEVHANSALYRDKEELEALQVGAVQMLAPAISKFAVLGVREFEAFELPYLFDSHEKLNRVVRSTVGQAMMAKLDARGITALTLWDNGVKSFSSNRPMRRPQDFEGLRMRIQPSMVIEAQMRALGAVPQVIAFSDVHAALRRGLVDGTECTPSNLYTQRLHEQQRHLVLTDHGYLGYAVVVNKRFWQGLPGPLRHHLTQAMNEATAMASRDARASNARALAAIKAAGHTTVYVPSAVEHLAFKRRLLPVHREMANHIGPDVLASIYAATGFDPARV
jgi:C4-dicarboxylate-binding protein DctP